MSICSFFPDISFHLRCTRTMLPTNICCLLSLCLHFFIFLWLVFLTFKDNSTHDCFFYTHILSY
nr:MAG TPA: hypothetical protein [Caudoviricetes sp.]